MFSRARLLKAATLPRAAGGTPALSSLQAETLTWAKPRVLRAPCEDLVGHQGDTFWLLDGSSTPKRLHCPGLKANGAFLVQHLDFALRALLLLKPDMPLLELLALAEEEVGAYLRQLHPEVGPAVLKYAAPHASVVLVRRLPWRIEYALLQDATLLVRPGPGAAVQVLKDSRQAEFNADYLADIAAALRAGDAFGARYAQLLDEMVDREREHRNKDGFFTFTGFDDAAAHAVYGEMAITKDSELVLASDGAARYWTHFGGAIEDVFRRPLPDVAQAVRDAEAADPEAKTYPRIGAADDIGLMRVR